MTINTYPSRAHDDTLEQRHRVPRCYARSHAADATREHDNRALLVTLTLISAVGLGIAISFGQLL